MHFILFNLNIIVLVIWVAFLAFIAFRFFCGAWASSQNKFLSKVSLWVKDISFKKLIVITFGLNIFYGLFVSWGQYYVWANSSSDFLRALVNLPLPKETPMQYFEWIRPLFENHLGYFLYYSFGRFWLYILISFLISGALYYLFKLWESHYGNFTENGPELLLVLMLISGWPSILILIPLGFIFSILLSAVSYAMGKKVIKIEPAFIIATFITLIFGRIILGFL